MIKITYLLLEIFAIVISTYIIHEKKIRLSIYSFLFMLFEVFYMLLVDNEMLSGETLPIIYISFVLFVLLEFNESIWNAVYKSILSLLVVTIMQMIIYFPGVIIYELTQDDRIMAVFVNLFTLIIIFFTRNMNIYTKISKLCDKKQLKYFLVVMVAFSIITYYIYRIKGHKTITLDVYVVSLIFIITVIYVVLRWQKANYETEIKEKQIDSIRSCDQSLQRLIQDTRKNQHDFHNHLIAIFGMHSSIDTYEELVKAQEEYCNKIQDKNLFNKILYGINDSILAGFVYNKVCNIAEKGVKIKFKVRVYSDKIEYISIYDLNEIIGILIDNACEAVLGNNVKQQIYFEIIENDNKLTIGIRNRSNVIPEDDIIRFFKAGYSNKAENRGLGLSKIIDLRNKYNFEIFVNNRNIESDNWFEIIITIKKRVSLKY
ncbi:MAG: GHKL domain-containing protein [Eubacterium sp.]|nr:GHKL domain-containing protein [Eubacterium sp.]